MLTKNARKCSTSVWDGKCQVKNAFSLNQPFSNWSPLCLKNAFPVLSSTYCSTEVLLHFQIKLGLGHSGQLDLLPSAPEGCAAGGLGCQNCPEHPWHRFALKMVWHYSRTVNTSWGGSFPNPQAGVWRMLHYTKNYTWFLYLSFLDYCNFWTFCSCQQVERKQYCRCCPQTSH